MLENFIFLKKIIMSLEKAKFQSLKEMIEHIKNEDLKWELPDLTDNLPEEIKIINPFDMHLHLRDWEMLTQVAPLSAKQFCWALVMPNLVPPIEDLKYLEEYKNRILESVSKGLKTSVDNIFTPYMTLNFRSDYSRKFLEQAKEKIIWIKMYPKGLTTNSDSWIEGFDLEELRPVLENMQELEIPLNIHWETDWFVMDAEREYAWIYEILAKEFPKLKIIMEHITTKQTAELVDKYDNLYATVTLHHLVLTLDNVAKWSLQPHNYCKPIAKTPEDRVVLLKKVLNWNPKIMFWSDSAPHPQDSKESEYCSAWAFSAPNALQALAEIFTRFWKQENLQNFVSNNAKNIYGEILASAPEKTIILKLEENNIPEKIEWKIDIVPFMPGKKLSYKI